MRVALSLVFVLLVSCRVDRDESGASTTELALHCTPDEHMAPASSWSMPETTDDLYVCYGFDVRTTEKRHVVAIAPHIDNRTLIHHAVLLQTDEAVSATPAPCPSTSPKWRIIYGWAPGVGNLELPSEAGFPQEGTTHYVVQLHYSNLQHRPGLTDASGFDFCTTNELRPNDADALEFGSLNFHIPPRSTTDLSCAVTMPTNLGGPLHLFAAFPHMHQTGTKISSAKVDPSGAPVFDMGTRTSWDFQNQYYIPIDGLLGPGDTVRTQCQFKNTTDHVISFGERTEDEMCFTFAIYWPKITMPSWTWASLPLRTRCETTVN